MIDGQHRVVTVVSDAMVERAIEAMVEVAADEADRELLAECDRVIKLAFQARRQIRRRIRKRAR